MNNEEKYKQALMDIYFAECEVSAGYLGNYCNKVCQEIAEKALTVPCPCGRLSEVGETLCFFCGLNDKIS